MKTQYSSLVDFAKEIERLDSLKRDFVAPGASITMFEDEKVVLRDIGEFPVTDFAHGQLAQKLEIPKAYYDRMGEVPGLRSINVNEWLRHEPVNHMVRTLDGKARAFLSDRYRPIDNILVMNAFLPVLTQDITKQFPEVKVWASTVSETRMYLQIVFPNLSAEIKTGDVVNYGVVLTNSEVGRSAVDIKKFIARLVCMNGAIGQSILRQYHLGKRIDDSNIEIYADDTIQAEMESLRLRMRDVIKNALTFEEFNKEVEKLKIAAGDKIPIINVQSVVEEVTKRYNVPLSTVPALVGNMADAGDLSRYGLSNSFTAMAHRLDNPDDQYEYEKLGQKIIELNPGEWKTILEVAA